MAMYTEMSKEELHALKEQLTQEYTGFQQQNLALDMSRGKPAPTQVALSAGMLQSVTDFSEVVTEGGSDSANYGLLAGLPEARSLMGELLEIDAKNVFVGGNSSLNLMHDCIALAYAFGVIGSEKPWKDQPVKFLCPSPGYDRHFSITEHFGFELIPVEMTPDGPNLAQIDELIQDPAVKGMWAVPKYSNPTGVTYSDETVRHLANLSPAAPDFRIFWDNAYSVHHLDFEHPDQLLNIATELEKTGKEDMVMMFCSTSKITFPGGGISAIGCSDANMAWLTKHFSYQTISYDKINQLRHVKFFPNMTAVTEHMKKHAGMLSPKFEIVLRELETLTGLGIAQWEHPRGGYFVSLDVLSGCAKRVIALCKDAGVIMTSAGATYPYGNDPYDKTIRIAPSYPTCEELEQAAKLLCLCVRLASVEKLLAE